MNLKRLLGMLVLLSFLSSACGVRQQIRGSQAPVQPKAAKQKKSKGTGAPSAPQGAYTVVPGDTLWALSDKFYGDFFQWPLLFTNNQNTIQDPDLIYRGQTLGIKKPVTQKEASVARKKAMETPKYVPHTKVRNPLPLDYNDP